MDVLVQRRLLKEPGATRFARGVCQAFAETSDWHLGCGSTQCSCWLLAGRKQGLKGPHNQGAGKLALLWKGTRSVSQRISRSSGISVGALRKNAGSGLQNPSTLMLAGLMRNIRLEFRTSGRPRQRAGVATCCAGAPVLSEAPASWRVRQEVDARDAAPLHEVAGGVVCLGKFDALHLGHQALAARAAPLGTPYMLSFSNMAAVLGWEPRLPLLASCHRPAVLRQWASVCGGLAPREVLLDFRTVRSLSPAAFVDLLADELCVKGIVAGDNYRFGFKAAGDATALQSLGEARGLAVAIVGSITDCGPHCAPAKEGLTDRMISSTRVRQALGRGDLACVEQLLGRRHQLAVWCTAGSFASCLPSDDTSQSLLLQLPRSDLLNEPPCQGRYEAFASIMVPLDNGPEGRNGLPAHNIDGREHDRLGVLDLGLAEVYIQADHLEVRFRDQIATKRIESEVRTLEGPHILSLEFKATG